VAEGLPTFVSQSRAARELGLPLGTLRDMARISPVYAPITNGLPGSGPEVRGRRPGRRSRLYHREQLRTLEALILGTIDLAGAELRLDLIRRRGGQLTPTVNLDPRAE